MFCKCFIVLNTTNDSQFQNRRIHMVPMKIFDSRGWVVEGTGVNEVCRLGEPQTLDGPFSAVPTPIAVTKAVFESAPRDPQNSFQFRDLRSQIFT